MKLEAGREGITIIPESAFEVSYIEDLLGAGGDGEKLVFTRRKADNQFGFELKLTMDEEKVEVIADSPGTGSTASLKQSFVTEEERAPRVRLGVVKPMEKRTLPTPIRHSNAEHTEKTPLSTSSPFASIQQEGYVHRFPVNGTFGFIRQSNGNDRDIFFHVSSVNPGFAPKEGDFVMFDLKQGRNGPEAINIVRIKYEDLPMTGRYADK